MIKRTGLVVLHVAQQRFLRNFTKLEHRHAGRDLTKCDALNELDGGEWGTWNLDDLGPGLTRRRGGAGGRGGIVDGWGGGRAAEKNGKGIVATCLAVTVQMRIREKS